MATLRVGSCDHCARGWVCEAHPESPWPHGSCAGPGMRCLSPSCPWWTDKDPGALHPEGLDFDCLKSLQQHGHG